MNNKSIATALTLGFLAFIFLAIQLSPEAVTEEYAKLIRQYRCTTVYGDRYGGEWPREQFRKHGVNYEPADPKLIDPETGRLRKASKCPPGQTDKLENYAGRCVDPKLIDPETGRLRKASKCAPGESDTTKHYKGTCVRLDQLDETGRLRKQIGKEKSPQEETAPQRPMKIIKKKPQAEENPCGKGWYKAADGQCYPRLN
jgi:hypothetical protein